MGIHRGKGKMGSGEARLAVVGGEFLPEGRKMGGGGVVSGWRRWRNGFGGVGDLKEMGEGLGGWRMVGVCGRWVIRSLWWETQMVVGRRDALVGDSVGRKDLSPELRKREEGRVFVRWKWVCRRHGPLTALVAGMAPAWLVAGVGEETGEGCGIGSGGRWIRHKEWPNGKLGRWMGAGAPTRDGRGFMQWDGLPEMKVEVAWRWWAATRGGRCHVDSRWKTEGPTEELVDGRSPAAGMGIRRGKGKMGSGEARLAIVGGEFLPEGRKMGGRGVVSGWRRWRNGFGGFGGLKEMGEGLGGWRVVGVCGR